MDWMDAYDMPEPPMNDKGRPKWAHAHQAKFAFIDTEFLTFHVDHHFITDVAIWLEEETAPRCWRIKPSPSLMDLAERKDPKMWSGIQRAASVNGYTPEEWAEARVWDDVKVEIAKAAFGRVLVGNNVYAADILRLASGFWPRDTQWLAPHRSMDLQWLARMCGHQKTSLNHLCSYYGIEEETVHRADGGCRRVRTLTEKMVRRIDK